MKKLLFIVIILFIFLSAMVGCGSVPNPEETVKDFWSAFKDGDYNKAANYLAKELNVDSIQKNFWPEDGENLSDDQIAIAYLSRLDLIVKGHEINDNTAIVEVDINWPDMELWLGNFMVQAMEKAFTAALGGASQEEIDIMLKPIFLEVLDETPDVTTAHSIELELVENEWKISTHPFPNPEEIFNIPDFATEREGEEEVEMITYQMGEEIQIESTDLPELAGEPKLTGSLSITFLDKKESPSVEDLLYGEINAEGVFYVVYYSISNEVNSRIQPSTQINDLFYLSDAGGRRWEVASYLTHDTDISAAFAIQKGYTDPKQWVSPGFEKTTAIAFDIPEQASGLSLCSDELGISVQLD